MPKKKDYTHYVEELFNSVMKEDSIRSGFFEAIRHRLRTDPLDFYERFIMSRWQKQRPTPEQVDALTILKQIEEMDDATGPKEKS